VTTELPVVEALVIDELVGGVVVVDVDASRKYPPAAATTITIMTTTAAIALPIANLFLDGALKNLD